MKNQINKTTTETESLIKQFDTWRQDVKFIVVEKRTQGQDRYFVVKSAVTNSYLEIKVGLATYFESQIGDEISFNTSSEELLLNKDLLLKLLMEFNELNKGTGKVLTLFEYNPSSFMRTFKF